MNVYEISYQAALDGEYRKRAHHTSWDNYFDRMGARVVRPYGGPELELSLDHLQNIVNLIYSGRKQGGEEVVIELDNEEAKTELWEHSYVFGYLPEVLAEFELKCDQPMLLVTFREGVHTPGYRSCPPGTSPIEKELMSLSKKELNDRLDEIFADYDADKADSQQSVLPKDAYGALGTAASAGTYRAVSLPNWVIAKYQLTGDDAIPGNKLADSFTGLNEIFKLKQP
jgi:hypothetical protein